MAGETLWTAGPWAWFGKGAANDLYLATTHSGRRFVMGFKRWGTQQAQPTFQIDGRMVPASEMVRFDVGDRDVVGIKAAKAAPSVYRYDISAIDHPDARLIASAPEMAELLEVVVNGDPKGRFTILASGNPVAVAEFWETARTLLSKIKGEA